MVRIPEFQLTSERAHERAGNRRAAAKAGRGLVIQAREMLEKVGAELKDVPTDMADSEQVRTAYEAAFEHMRHEDWPELRDQLVELAVLSLGWAARIDLAEAREQKAA